MENLEVRLGSLELRSPLLTASGTAGHSNEIECLNKSRDIISCLGAFVTKGITLQTRRGNPTPRIVELRSGAGIINSIGLQNGGLKNFLTRELPLLKGLGVPVIVNISAGSVEGFGELASKLLEGDRMEIISGIEINVSCPNLKKGGQSFGSDPRIVERIVKKVKRAVKGRVVTVITKLTPNITDITLSARAAISGGTDVLSMINTLRGMAIDISTGRAFLGNKTGGLSGPAIKPVGVFMVHECFKNIPECRKREIPIIGMGGIVTWQDSLEYIMAGATAVAAGTAWLVDPGVFRKIHSGMKKYLKEHGKKLSELTGIVHRS